MIPQEIIRRKRDGAALSRAEIESMVAATVNGEASDSQLAAFAMAVLLNGMSRRETTELTSAMANSGDTIDWRQQELGGPRVDKHSTGGVGDKVSLILAPMLAACGVFVPMVSGRGLGHTGGTLDKLEAIPGYQVEPPQSRFARCVQRAGCAIVGASPSLAPADRRLYAIRDVTATVESTPLIVSSILAKKLAVGLDALVLDVKAGTGAFCADLATAMDLAGELAAVATAAGVPTRSVVTDMSQVLGTTAGNALEVGEALACLRGERTDSRLLEVTLALGTEVLVLGGLAQSGGQAREQLTRTIESGCAADRFARMVAELGGPLDFVERADRYLNRTEVVEPVFPDRPGRVCSIDVRSLGMAIVTLGGGRTHPEDQVDHRVGMSELAGIGEHVDRARPLALVHAADGPSARACAAAVRRAVEVSAGTPSPSDTGTLVYGRFGSGLTERPMDEGGTR